VDPHLALNDPQRQAVLHRGDEPLLVIAGAGTGKTTTLAHRIAQLVIDGADPRRILLLTFSLTRLTGMGFGLLPALKASNPDQWGTLKDTVGGIAGTGGSLFLRKGLVAAQVALSFLLLFGAGLFVRSLQNLQTTDTGVELDNLVTFRLNPALSGYADQQGVNFYRDLLDRLNSSPGVKSAGTAAVSILAGDEWDSTMSVEGHQAKDGEDMQAFMNSLSPGHFKTMEIPFLEGRAFPRPATISNFNP